MTSTSDRRRRGRQAARDEAAAPDGRRRGSASDADALGTRYRTRAWLGMYVEPVLVVLVALPFGLRSADEPPDDVRLVAALVLVVLGSLVPCVVDVVLQHRELAPEARRARAAGRKAPRLVTRLAWRLTGWGCAQAVVAAVATLPLRWLGGPEWAELAAALFVFVLPVLGAALAGLLGLLVFLGVRFLVLAIRPAADGEPVFGRVALGAVGVVLLGAVVGAPAMGAYPGRVTRGVGPLVGFAGWAFSDDGPAALLWLGRVSTVLVGAGLVTVVGVTGQALWSALVARPDAAAPDRDPVEVDRSR